MFGVLGESGQGGMGPCLNVLADTVSHKGGGALGPHTHARGRATSHEYRMLSEKAAAIFGILGESGELEVRRLGSWELCLWCHSDFVVVARSGRGGGRLSLTELIRERLADD